MPIYVVRHAYCFSKLSARPALSNMISLPQLSPLVRFHRTLVGIASSSTNWRWHTGLATYLCPSEPSEYHLVARLHVDRLCSSRQACAFGSMRSLS